MVWPTSPASVPNSTGAMAEEDKQEMTTVGTVPETLDDSKTQASLQPAQVPPSPVSSQASGVLVQATKPVEALDWRDLATNPMVPYCNSCGQVVNQSVMTEAVRRKGHQKLMRQSCRSVTNMLYKRVNMSDLNFRDLDDDQACFFPGCPVYVYYPKQNRL